MDVLPATFFTSLHPVPGEGGEAPMHVQNNRHAAAIAAEVLHPDLWRGHQFGRHAEQCEPSGFAALDAQLPGGGWPRRVLTELLLPHPGVGEIRLLSHCLRATQRCGRPVMLFDPPATLSGWALAQLGLDVEQLLIIVTCAQPAPGERLRACEWLAKTPRPASRIADAVNIDARLWALEQTLKSGHAGAVLAWLPPRLRGERLRRLQLAAHAHDGVAFILREMAAAKHPSAAPLRLGLRPAGADILAVSLLKRRGPPLELPLQLALPPVLCRSARQRAGPGLRQAPVLRPVTFVNLV